MSAYYNEIDSKAAAWLRELIKQGHIADGDVDERSIEDVTPNELRKYTQCHFFAGIGIWSHALRQAGWTDDRPIWTGSCPCQPFSSAGKGAGVDDERHLWPAFHWLIKQCQPGIVLGEQVAHKAGAAWFDIVSTDLEGEDYACGKIVFPACGVGAPHLRQRQYWVGHSSSEGLPERDSREVFEPREVERLERPDSSSKLANTNNIKRSQFSNRECKRQKPGSPDSSFTELGYTLCTGLQGTFDVPFTQQPEKLEPGFEPGASQLANSISERQQRESGGRDAQGLCGASECSLHDSPGPTNGHWRDADWLGCRDDKWRPVEPGTFPLANGSPERVGRLRGYGNGIVAQQAQAFIECVMGGLLLNENKHETLLTNTAQCATFPAL